jgi:hypothetical protein
MLSLISDPFLSVAVFTNLLLFIKQKQKQPRFFMFQKSQFWVTEHYQKRIAKTKITSYQI